MKFTSHLNVMLCINQCFSVVLSSSEDDEEEVRESIEVIPVVDNEEKVSSKHDPSRWIEIGRDTGKFVT